MKKISILFNIILIIFQLGLGAIVAYFDPQINDFTHFDALYAESPAKMIFMCLLLVVALYGVTPKIIQHFWNKLISDIFHFREISFQEALSILIIFCFFI